jgi:hypothetical protein
MKLYSIRPYDYTDDITPDDSPWIDESYTGEGHYLVYAESELEARETISKKDNGEALGIIRAMNESPLSKSFREHTGVGFEQGNICPFMDRNYTECKELLADNEGIILGDTFVS